MRWILAHLQAMQPLEDPVGKAPVPGPAPANAAPRPAELEGPEGPEPTRYGDWERKGRCIDF
jgi:hypothetical protein